MLKVWLPLTGDLHNQGISDVTATGHSVTSAAAGKIGSCYQFTTSAIELNDKIFNNSVTEFTVTAWMKFNNSNSACLFSDRTEINSTGITLFIMDSGKIYYDVGARWEFTPSTAIPRNQWFHIAFLYKRGVLRQVYLNGALIGSTTSAPAPTSTSTSRSFIGASQNSSTALGGNYFNGWMNDIRIYDHCLSAAEVKEIAQGLVLHYKLDNNGCGGRNLLRIGTGNFHNTDKLTTITWSGWDQYDSLPLTDIDWNNHYGDQITYSCYMENVEQTSGTGTGIMLHFRYADGTYQQFGGGKNGTAGQYLASGESGWLKLTVTIPNASTRSSPTTIARVEASVRHNSSSGASTIRYQYPQVEYGNKQTTWSWAPEDIGDDPARIEDSSGYNHNGSILNDTLISSDTPRYSTSTNLIAGNSAINCGRGGMVTDSITVNMWLKSSGWGNPVSCTEGGGWNFESSGNGFRFPVYLAGVGYKAAGVTTTTRAQLCNNQWHMITGVYDRLNQKIRVYIDANLEYEENTSSSALIGYHGSNVIWIGAEASGSATAIGSNGMAGLFSDFRIYCTPLLDTDIKQLYNVSMKVDKSQNIHTYELYQKDENKLYKTGVLSNSSFNEINNLFNLLYDKQLYIEPDGSCWIRIFHHANCDTKLFASSDTFTTSVYKDADRWFNISLCNKVNKWELMVKSMPTAGGTETKYRWIQTKNPMTAAYADVAAASVTKVTGNGYASYGWGGLYHSGSSTYLATNNGTNGNWWGAVGAWAHHQGGIPGWTTVITTGYEDVYLRIDNLDQVNLHAKNIKAGMWTANQFIER